jgi:methyl acetate hydrolase
MVHKERIDALLTEAVPADVVPGVVTVATDREGTIYEGAFGLRTFGEEAHIISDTVLSNVC